MTLAEPSMKSLIESERMIELLMQRFHKHLIDAEIEAKFMSFSVQSTLATLHQNTMMNFITGDEGDGAIDYEDET